VVESDSSSDDSSYESEDIEISDTESTTSSDYETEEEYKKNSKNSKKTTNKKTKKSKCEDDSDNDDSDEDYEDGDEVEEFDNVEYKKLLAELFPSNYSKKNAQSSSKIPKKTKKDSSIQTTAISKKKTDKKSKRAKCIIQNEEDDKQESEHTEEENDYDGEEDEDNEDSNEDNEEEKKINIIFTIGGAGGGNNELADLENEYYDNIEYIENQEAVDANEDCDTDDEKVFMKEKYEHIDVPILEEDEQNKNKRKSCKEKQRKKKAKAQQSDIDIDDSEQDIETEYSELLELKKHLLSRLASKPKSKMLKGAIRECKESILKLIKKGRTKNAKKYHKMIYNSETRPNEIDYFKKKMSNKQQLQIMRDLKEINQHMNIEKPYRLALLESSIPAKLKAIALQKLNVLRTMEPGDPEYYKIKNWVDTFMRIPFGIYSNLSVTMTDGLEVCNRFMETSKELLDNCVYGLNDAKLQILQMVGQWISNPSAMGTAIAIKGPPGTGKTSLVKDGISKILGREFAFIALGGTGDSSFLEGHSYTYEGSSWGKIVQILINSKCMNPVIYFDELDKISDTPRGEEIVGILTHLTDTSQNSQFHDKYFSEIDFDLSKCLFIFSYNDESKVNPILKDRMYRIQTKGYDMKEKLVIARKYLLPKIREQVNFKEDDVIIPDETIQYITSNKFLTQEEAGVRNLKRCLEIIHTKLNLFRLVNPVNNIFSSEIELNVTFPFTVEKKHVDILIKNNETHNQSLLAMYI
jgi:ATP-dependent Lon protease